MSLTSNGVQLIDEPFENCDLAGYTSPGWYFWDETITYCYGPYDTRELAQTGLVRYCKDVLLIEESIPDEEE